jgi:aminoglycoside 6'-N-acetyltransferase
MIATQQYRFRKATLEDLALLEAWQSNPHVRAWWGSDAPYDAAKLADPRVDRWIVSKAERPFAYMQDYTVHGWEDHHFFHLPKGARGIDQYIGDPDMIGLGHGAAFINARMQVLFAQGAPVIATDPHPNNERAIAVYMKLGFETSGPAQKTRWGLIVPMLAFARAAGRHRGHPAPSLRR